MTLWTSMLERETVSLAKMSLDLGTLSERRALLGRLIHGRIQGLGQAATGVMLTARMTVALGKDHCHPALGTKGVVTLVAIFRLAHWILIDRLSVRKMTSFRSSISMTTRGKSRGGSGEEEGSRLLLTVQALARCGQEEVSSMVPGARIIGASGAEAIGDHLARHRGEAPQERRAPERGGGNKMGWTDSEKNLLKHDSGKGGETTDCNTRSDEAALCCLKMAPPHTLVVNTEAVCTDRSSTYHRRYLLKSCSFVELVFLSYAFCCVRRRSWAATLVDERVSFSSTRSVQAHL